MRALIQRVRWGKVVVADKTIGEIGPGVVTFLGIGIHDTETDVEKMISKIAKLRIFEDENGKMNHSLLDRKYAQLLVSQFTLYGDLEKGNRPSFVSAARPEVAQKLYDKAVSYSKSLGIPTACGEFQTHMEVSLLNDGPVTFWLDSSS